MNPHFVKKTQRSLFLTLSLLVVFSFLLAACGPAATMAAPTEALTEAATEVAPTEAAPAATEEPKPLPPSPSSSTNPLGSLASRRWSTSTWKRPAIRST